MATVSGSSPDGRVRVLTDPAYLLALAAAIERPFADEKQIRGDSDRPDVHGGIVAATVAREKHRGGGEAAVSCRCTRAAAARVWWGRQGGGGGTSGRSYRCFLSADHNSGAMYEGVPR